MNLAGFRRWVRQIYATRADELDCNEVAELIPEYVDIEIAGENPGRYHPGVSHHLAQCARCRDLYEGVRDAVQAEEAERSESVSVDVQQQPSSPVM